MNYHNPYYLAYPFLSFVDFLQHQHFYLFICFIKTKLTSTLEYSFFINISTKQSANNIYIFYDLSTVDKYIRYFLLVTILFTTNLFIYLLFTFIYLNSLFINWFSYISWLLHSSFVIIWIFCTIIKHNIERQNYITTQTYQLWFINYYKYGSINVSTHFHNEYSIIVLFTHSISRMKQSYFSQHIKPLFQIKR